MRERGGRTRIRGVTEVHGRDQPAVHGEYVNNLAVRKYIAAETLNKLVYPDVNLARRVLRDRQRFHMRIELSPLPGPIGADLFLSNDFAALRRFRPAYVFGHQR